MVDNAISDDFAVAGVMKEVLRVLPFWKIFVELREAYGRKPTVVSCDVSIKSRMECSHFIGVDVLWVQSEIVLVNWRRPPKRKGVPKDIPNQYVEIKVSFGSMHFVHRNAHLIGYDQSYHLQSVVLLQRPEQLQCIAGNMVHFAFLVYGMLQLTLRNHSVEAHETLLPPSTSTVLILGMGGNSMECGLRYILGSQAHIYVAEIEPSVVRICKSSGQLKENTETHVLIQSAEGALQNCPEECSFIFMDVFEPLSGCMINSMNLIEKAFQRLATNGILVINEHSLPTTKDILPLIELFGDGNVQFINVRGWNESVITAVKPGGKFDGHGVLCSKRLAYEVLHSYDKPFPGWMPRNTFIERSKILYAKTESKILHAREWIS
ncbi:uncharacterized protein TM35_000025260 [Trypanosoma theileri]|uniref:Spermidine synthase n=1 Tax=Trypanosoma theileri TaxID=67003 RepID=A0A1X0P9R8_9TRYP|nr:uncharacterized protein TM35_000025260 [Trypanosoma theileri]ORC93200.1 hypothetical protein TM35_000025260 [Trypanosoma theileri]